MNCVFVIPISWAFLFMSSANLSTLPDTATAMFAAASFAEYTSMAIMSSRSVGESPAL